MKVIHSGPAERAGAQGAVGGLAICRETVGSSGIYMACYRIPPGRRSIPHYHTNCETAVYVLSGHGRAYFGPSLGEVLDASPGDLVYIPPDEVHLVENLSESEWLEYVAARHAPEEIVVAVRGGYRLVRASGSAR